MKGKQSGQRGFSDHLLQSKVSEADFLVQIESLIDWAPLDEAISGCYSDMGRPSEPPFGAVQDATIAEMVRAI